MSQPKVSSKSKSSKSDASKVHKLALKGSSKVVNEFASAHRAIAPNARR
jgi:mitotic spindle assembly checkpoint protein MAD2